MKMYRTFLRRPAAFAAALALLAGSCAPLLTNYLADAAQVSGRSISLSDSTPGATGVVYALTMTMPTAAKSMIVDFCSESPIIGGACTAPTGMDALTSGAYTSTNPGTNAPPGSGGAGSAPTGFSVGTFTASRFRITSSTATTAATKYTFYFTGIKNPTTTGTFYARVYTYSDSTYGSTGTAYSSATAPGSYVDYGGFALATANNISITATVMEQLTFCVSGATMTSGCTGMTTPNLTLGSGSPITLGTALSTSPAYTMTSTNALSGVVVRMKNSNSCAGLSRDGGTTCPIAPVGASAAAIGTGSGKFGMYVTATGGNTTPASPYNGGTTTYGMDNTANTGVTGTYGNTIFTSTGALSDELDTLTYGAAAATTTPAGVYTATMILIATGTF